MTDGSLPGPGDATSLLRGAAGDDPAAVERLTSLLYEELRVVAARMLRGERRDHSLQPTALVNETYLRLIDQAGANLGERTRFLAVAAHVMRQVLVDHARHRNAQKRLGGRVRVTLGDDAAVDEGAALDALVLDEALERLAAIDARRAQVVVQRVFGGLSLEEVAEVMNVSRATVAADWHAARAWLRRELKGAGDS